MVAVSPKLSEITLIASPVPANDDLKLSFNTLSTGNFILDIYNTSGKLVYTSEINADKGFNENLIDLSTFNPGIYQVHLSGNNKVNKIKFIKE